MAKKKMPKNIGGSILSLFSNLVDPGEYIYMCSSDIPAGIPSAGPDCQGIVIAASTLYSSDFPDLPPEFTPFGTVFLLRGFRTIPSGSPPRKVDDTLYYASSDGIAWSIHSKESPDHHLHVMSSSDFQGLIDDWDLPAASKGTLDEYRAAGGELRFQGPLGGDSDSS